MSEVIPRLCGGTFFNLLLQARIQKNHPTQGDLLNSLMKIYDPHHVPMKGQNLKTIPSRFKTCDPTLNSDYLKLGNPFLTKSFTLRMANSYSDVALEMKDLLDRHFMNEESRKWLVRSLLELIEDDTYIADDERFFVNPGNAASYKSELMTCSVNGTVYFYCFILGIWYYCCTKDFEAGIGRSTYLSWTKESDIENKERKFISSIGTNRFEAVEIKYQLEKESQALRTVEEQLYIQYESKDSNTPRYEMLLPVIQERIHRSLANMNSKYEKYLKKAKKKHSRRDTFLYETERVFYNFFVCNDICEKKQVQIGSAWLKQRRSEDDGLCPPIKNLTIDKFPANQRKIHLVGTGGLGKSMMMNHLMLNTIDQYGEDLLPVFVTLKNYDSERNDLLDFVYIEFSRHDNELLLSDLTEKLGSGKALILLDGLDEIKSTQRTEFDQQFELLLDHYPDAFYIISSRPDIKIAALKHFTSYSLLPFTLDQAIEMVKKLDKNVVNDETKRDFINDLKKDIFNFSRDEKTQFLGNPLFLSIMLLTYDGYHNIPSQRYLFYEQAYEVMAEKHDAKKSLRREFETGLSSRDFKKLFGEFCAITYNDENYSFTETQLKDYAQQVIDANGYTFDVSRFIEDITKKVCLLYKDGGRYYFIHRSFQEYFTAYFFSIQLEKSFEAIFNMFMERDECVGEDQTLEMLYGIDEKKTAVHIIIPFLKPFFSRKEDGYQSFIMTIYQSIAYVVDETNQWPITAPASQIFRFICKINDIDPEYMFDHCDIPIDGSFVTDELVRYNSSWDIPGTSETRTIIRKSEIPYEYSEYEDRDELDVVGYCCEMDLTELYAKPNMHKEVIEAIEKDGFPLKQLYKKIETIYDNLNNKYSGEPKAKSFINNFH